MLRRRFRALIIDAKAGDNDELAWIGKPTRADVRFRARPEEETQRAKYFCSRERSRFHLDRVFGAARSGLYSSRESRR